MKKQELDQTSIIAKAVESAQHLLATQAQDAVSTIAKAAAEATKVTSLKDGNDHDLIIEIKTVQQTMLGEIREIKDGTAARISALEEQKLDTKDSYPMIYKKNVDAAIQDHETRIRSNETNITRILTWGSVLLILLSIAEFFAFKLLIH